MRDLDNFLPADIEAAHDFLLAIKALFPRVNIPPCWDDDEGIEQVQPAVVVYFRCGRAGRLDGLIDPLFSASFPTHAAGDLLAEGILAGGTGDERFSACSGGCAIYGNRRVISFYSASHTAATGGT